MNNSARRNLLQLILIFLLTSLVPTAIAATWRTNSPMSHPRQFHAAEILTNDTVLVAGGETAPGEAIASAEIFLPNSDTWIQVEDMGEARMLFTMTGLTNGLVLVSGGFNNAGENLDSAELFDPQTGTWELTVPMINARSAHTATLLTNGNVLIVGGRNAEGVVGGEIFDVHTRTWAATEPMITPRDYHSATLLGDGKVLILGGRNESGELLAGAELYDPATDSWQSTTNMNSARRSHTATYLPTIGKVLVVGGEALGGELFDPVAGTWTDLQIGGGINALRGHSATLLPNGLVLIASGIDETSEDPINPVSTTSWLYYPTTDSWSAPFLLTQGRYQHTATPLPDSKVLVLGGGNFIAPFRLPTTETFNLFDHIILTAGVAMPQGIQLAFTNTPNLIFSVMMTTNFPLESEDWTNLGNASEVAPGQFQFVDLQTSNSPMRFYRVRAN